MYFEKATKKDEILNFYLTLNIYQVCLKFIKIAWQKRTFYQKPVSLDLGLQL